MTVIPSATLPWTLTCLSQLSFEMIEVQIAAPTMRKKAERPLETAATKKDRRCLTRPVINDRRVRILPMKMSAEPTTDSEWFQPLFLNAEAVLGMIELIMVL